MKIGEWIDNREHPLQELTECRFEEYKRHYEKILFYIRFIDTGYKSAELVGQYYQDECITDISETFEIYFTSAGEWVYHTTADTSLNNMVAHEVELIAYMLIPECEVGRE